MGFFDRLGQRKVAELEKNNSSLVLENKGLKVKLEELTGKADILEAKVVEEENKIDGLVTENTDLKARLVKTEERVNQLEERNNALEELTGDSIEANLLRELDKIKELDVFESSLKMNAGENLEIVGPASDMYNYLQYNQEEHCVSKNVYQDNYVSAKVSNFYICNKEWANDDSMQIITKSFDSYSVDDLYAVQKVMARDFLEDYIDATGYKFVDKEKEFIIEKLVYIGMSCNAAEKLDGTIYDSKEAFVDNVRELTRPIDKAIDKYADNYVHRSLIKDFKKEARKSFMEGLKHGGDFRHGRTSVLDDVEGRYRYLTDGLNLMKLRQEFLPESEHSKIALNLIDTMIGHKLGQYSHRNNLQRLVAVELFDSDVGKEIMKNREKGISACSENVHLEIKALDKVLKTVCGYGIDKLFEELLPKDNYKHKPLIYDYMDLCNCFINETCKEAKFLAKTGNSFDGLKEELSWNSDFDSSNWANKMTEFKREVLSARFDLKNACDTMFRSFLEDGFYENDTMGVAFKKFSHKMLLSGAKTYANEKKVILERKEKRKGTQGKDVSKRNSDGLGL